MTDMMKCVMKSTAAAFLVMAAIVAVQMGLTYAFGFQVGHVFGETAATFAFWYAFCRCSQKRRQRRLAAKERA